MALVSILIPAFNHERYVEKTLDSILGDSFLDKEIVIIDDGSTDGTDAAIRAWIGNHKDEIKITYQSRPNRGLTKTLNELLALSSGEYLVALASDDFLLEGGVANRVAYLENHPHKYAVFADCIMVDERGEKTHESGLFEYRKADKTRLLSDGGIRREFITNFAVPGPVLMVKRTFYTLFGGFNEEMYMEDYDLYLTFASKNVIGFTSEKVSAYRIHGANMSDVSNPKYLRLLVDSRKTLVRQMKNFNAFEKLLFLGEIAKFTVRIALFKLKMHSVRR